MIDPVTIWFETIEILCFKLGYVAEADQEYIDNSSAVLIQMFNHNWLF